MSFFDIPTGLTCILKNDGRTKGTVILMKVFRYILTTILILVPTILAVGLYYHAQRVPIAKKSVERIELVDTRGEEHTFRKENAEDSSAISFLVDILQDAEQVGELPGDVAQTTPFQVTFYSYDKEIAYQYYISRDPGKAFFVNADGVAFRIPSETAASFLCEKYAASLYPGSINPVLTLADGKEVVPSDYEWKYALNNGEYRRVECETTTEVLSYKINPSLEMNFNVTPDIFNVTVMDGTEVIFEDTYENLVNLRLTESKTLSFHVEADWREIDGKEGQGFASYDFTAQVNQPASFDLSWAGSEEPVPGDFALLTVKNAPSAASVSITTEPDIGYKPVLVPDGSYYRALIPFSYELAGGEYVIHCSCDGITQDLKVTLANKNFLTLDYAVSDNVLATNRSSAALAEFDEVFKPIASSLTLSGGRLFDGVFGEGVPAKRSVLTGVGVTRSVNNGAVTYRHQGVDYLVREGDELTAVNAGKVIYVGETTLSGKTVVIEHGFGLKSWYCHMSSISVNVDDQVKAGDTLGVVGNTGFCNGTTAHIGLSVFEVPVSPYKLWEAALEVPTP